MLDRPIPGEVLVLLDHGLLDVALVGSLLEVVAGVDDPWGEEGVGFRCVVDP